MFVIQLFRFKGVNMYISLIETKDKQKFEAYPIMMQELSGSNVETLTMESGTKWQRDNSQQLYIPEVVGRYAVTIEGDGIAAPNIKPAFIGKLFVIECKTRFIEYCTVSIKSDYNAEIIESENDSFCDERIVSRDYQAGTLAYHQSEQESAKPIRTYDLVDKITRDGLYSYRPVLYVRLQSVEITRDEKTTRWKLKFIEE